MAARILSKHFISFLFGVVESIKNIETCFRWPDFGLHLLLVPLFLLLELLDFGDKILAKEEANRHRSINRLIDEKSIPDQTWSLRLLFLYLLAYSNGGALDCFLARFPATCFALAFHFKARFKVYLSRLHELIDSCL